MRLNRYVVALITLLVVTGIAAGVLTGAFVSVGRAGLYATGLWARGGASTLPPGTFGTSPTTTTSTPAPEPEVEPLGQPTPVLAPAAPAAAKPARVAAKVNAVDRKKMKGRFSGLVIDAGTGRVLYAKNANAGFIPASTTKLLTTTAALSILGPEHRFSTRVVSPNGNRIILVGGGDPYLTYKANPKLYPRRASLTSLAHQTAKKLKATKRTKVSLGYDTSLFTGPAWNNDWPEIYADQVTPTSALWVNEGRVYSSPGPRVSNPAKEAANDFAAALKRQGIRVSSVAKARASKTATQIAEVKSMPLERIVEQLLMVSDNDAAEVVSRQAAIGAGRPGSSAAARKVVQSTLAKLGVWDKTAMLRDGSGLSRKTRVPADMLVKILRLDMAAKHPELRAVITGLPVAGVEGSLRVRYFDAKTKSARGLLRGKTGTLSKVHALAGYVRSPDGSVLVYAFLVNNPKNDFEAKVWLDRVSSALSSCGCR